MPPQDIEAEMAVLGAMMLDEEALSVSLSMLSEDLFHKDAHRKIFSACKSLQARNEPVDIVTVGDELEALGLIRDAGGRAYLGDVAASVPSLANVESYARIVQEKASLREMLRDASAAVEAAYSGQSPEEVARLLEDALEHQVGKPGSVRHIGEAIAEIRDAIERGEDSDAIPTRLVDLDYWIDGLYPEQLYVIGARPSMGKTAFALELIRRTSTKDKPGLIFSLETSVVRLAARILSRETKTAVSAIRQRRLKPEWLTNHSQEIAAAMTLPFYVDDRASLTVGDILAECKKLQRRRGLGPVMVDYLQLIDEQARNETRASAIERVAYGLLGVARTLKVPVIALSQLNRGAEGRRPTSADLRESGGIEQAADVILLLYRGEKNEPLEVIVAKNKDGPLGTARLFFDAETMRIGDLAQAS